MHVLVMSLNFSEFTYLGSYTDTNENGQIIFLSIRKIEKGATAPFLGDSKCDLTEFTVHLGIQHLKSANGFMRCMIIPATDVKVV